MIFRVIVTLGALAAFSFANAGASVEEAATGETVNAAPVPAIPAEKAVAAPAEAASVAPGGEAFRKALAALPDGKTEEERNERAALASFYETRKFEPLWLEASGALKPNASALAAEIKRATEWGLDPKDFPLPPDGEQPAEGAAIAPDALAAQELKISQAVLKYGRYAHGGRIMNPSSQLSSYLDRRPQLLKPETILEGIAAAEKPDAYLRDLHPKHVQFERLRQKYVALLNANKERTAEAKKLLANMEEWRWMPSDMGEIYVWNNIPEYLQRVIKDGKPMREARIVAGETGKQTPIFSRPLRKVTFKPTWIVPDSVKVHELLPDMLGSGHMMREYGLEVSRDGQPVNWRMIDWTRADIRAFEVTQPYQPMSVMGKFKFSFPNQHTVFMHDALPREKWMFQKAQRTYSHGCMRVANPIGLAEIVLREDRGWDARRVQDAVNNGRDNEEVALERAIPVHITYFTAMVDDSGKLHTFPDVYGHEKRITLALEGRWGQIAKGRNHLAPVELASSHRRHYAGYDDRDTYAPRRFQPAAGGPGRYFDPMFGEW